MSQAHALHRATVHSREHAADLVVFFEVSWGHLPHLTASEYLRQLLCYVLIVDPDDLDITAVYRERELEMLSQGGEATGDMRLFETGHWHGPIYAEPEHTLMLLCPATLARLLAAQRGLPIVDAQASMPAPL